MSAKLLEPNLTGAFSQSLDAGLLDAPAPVFSASPPGRLWDANEALAALLGHDSRENLLESVKDLAREVMVDRREFRRLSKRLEQEPEVRNMETRIRIQGGGVLWVHMSARAEKDEKGRLTGVRGVLVDVTEQKEREKRLREARDKYRILYENASEGLFEVSMEGDLVGGSNALAGVFGFSSLERMRLEAGNLWAMFEEPRTYRELVHRLEREGLVESFEAKGLKKGADTVWLSVNAYAFCDWAEKSQCIRGSVQDISDRKILEDRLALLKDQDELTGLMSRHMFLDMLDKSLARSRRQENFSFALVSLDVERFRLVNESLGRQAGDILLKKLGMLINQCLRTEDMCGRLGGDEFGLLLSDVYRNADAIRVVERIRSALREPLSVEGRNVFVTLNAGLVLSGEEYQSAEDMLNDADSAAYRARQDATLGFAVFNEQMQQEALERFRVETDLRQALEKNQFELNFQPIVSLSNGGISCFEALLRWSRPEIGMLSPTVFVPLLEETGLILPVGEWVLRRACIQTREWQERYPQHRELKVSVNVSPKQLQTEDFANRVKEVLDESGLPPNCLKLEITESLVMENPERAVEMLEGLREVGVSLSIDDFGTGYSSLAYLHRLPADMLKIDKSFIRDMREGAGNEIVRAIIVLAQALGKEVVAEGVESSHQLESLMTLHCQYVQGYYFSRPVTADEAEPLLEQGLV